MEVHDLARTLRKTADGAFVELTDGGAVCLAQDLLPLIEAHTRAAVEAERAAWRKDAEAWAEVAPNDAQADAFRRFAARKGGPK